MVVLFVDDDQDDFEIFCEALKKVAPGSHCLYKEHGAAALEFLREAQNAQPDYIFLDIHMPVMGGVECLKHIKADEKIQEIPVVLFSTSVSPSVGQEIKHLGLIDVIIKPAKFQEIVDVLAHKIIK